MRIVKYLLCAVCCLLVTGQFLSCKKGKVSFYDRPESLTAKELLQGVWIDEESEEVFFQMKGDSVYYPDSVSQTAYFKVVDDTLYIGKSAGYHIEKQTEHLLWFTNHSGEVVKLGKADEDSAEEVYDTKKTQILQLTEVLKRDSVVFLDGQRYHWYIAINPTRYKVVKSTYNEDGIQVDQVYYDNIIHVSIFQGSNQLFSQDLRKAIYAPRVPKDFLDQAILNDMEFDHADKDGFHFNATLCQPDAASCYVVENVITTDGLLSTKLLEY